MRTTRESKNAPQTLDQMKAANPDAFDFPSIGEAALPKAPTATLEEMLADFTPVEGKRGWYLRAPKIKQLKQIVAIISQGQEETRSLSAFETITQTLAQFVGLAEHLLWREGGQAMRPATEEEIEDDFELDELKRIVLENTGLKQSEGPGPNA